MSCHASREIYWAAYASCRTFPQPSASHYTPNPPPFELSNPKIYLYMLPFSLLIPSLRRCDLYSIRPFSPSFSIQPRPGQASYDCGGRSSITTAFANVEIFSYNTPHCHGFDTSLNRAISPSDFPTSTERRRIELSRLVVS